jgi:hypothetical protein
MLQTYTHFCTVTDTIALPCCGLEARPTTLLRKKSLLRKQSENRMKNLAESSKEGCGSKRADLPIMMMVTDRSQN